MEALASETDFVHMEESKICHIRFLENTVILVPDLQIFRGVHYQSRIPSRNPSPLYWRADGAQWIKSRGWPQGRWASTRGLSVHGKTDQDFQGCYTSTKNTAGPCLVLAQGWSSAKIPTESKDKVILGKVSFIFTALICDQFLKTILYLQNPTSRMHSYPTDLIQTLQRQMNLQ